MKTLPTAFIPMFFTVRVIDGIISSEWLSIHLDMFMIMIFIH